MLAAIALSVLNAGLVAVPIGGTAGVLTGIDYYRKINGQAPLFTNPPPPDSGGGGGYGGGGGGGNSTYPGWDGNKPNATTVRGGVTVSEYCQQYNSVLVNTTTGQNYTLNPNQWGWTESDGGGLCLNVTTNNNETYATNTTAPRWSATWEYPPASSDQPVHAYPNIMIDGDVLPAKLGSLSEMRLDMQWTYASGNKLVAGTNSTKRSINNVDFSANVAVDMFFDSNKEKSSMTSNATYEVMVWFAQFGQYTDPVGYADGIVASLVVDALNFTLYYGTNGKAQHVLTYIAQQTAATFSGSILQLLTALPTFGLKFVPTETDYIGYFAFGSEAYYAPSPVTFDVQNMAIDIW